MHLTACLGTSLTRTQWLALYGWSRELWLFQQAALNRLYTTPIILEISAKWDCTRLWTWTFQTDNYLIVYMFQKVIPSMRTIKLEKVLLKFVIECSWYQSLSSASDHWLEFMDNSIAPICFFVVQVRDYVTAHTSYFTWTNGTNQMESANFIHCLQECNMV